jgi:hypothetical protein
VGGGKAVNEVDAGRDRATPVARTAEIRTVVRRAVEGEQGTRREKSKG